MKHTYAACTLIAAERSPVRFRESGVPQSIQFAPLFKGGRHTLLQFIFQFMSSSDKQGF